MRKNVPLLSYEVSMGPSKSLHTHQHTPRLLFCPRVATLTSSAWIRWTRGNTRENDNDSLHDPHLRTEVLAGLLEHLLLLILVFHSLINQTTDPRVIVERRQELLGCRYQVSVGSWLPPSCKIDDGLGAR